MHKPRDVDFLTKQNITELHVTMVHCKIRTTVCPIAYPTHISGSNHAYILMCLLYLVNDSSNYLLPKIKTGNLERMQE